MRGVELEGKREKREGEMGGAQHSRHAHGCSSHKKVRNKGSRLS